MTVSSLIKGSHYMLNDDVCGPVIFLCLRNTSSTTYKKNNECLYVVYDKTDNCSTCKNKNGYCVGILHDYFDNLTSLKKIT